MRTLVTTDAVGGVWTYALDLAAGLAARGDEVTLAVLGPSPSAERAASVRVSGVALIDTGLPLDWTARTPAELGRAARGLAALAADRRAELVHLNSPALAADARLPAPVVGVAHSCLATWWAALRDGPPPADFAWRIAATARGYAACDALIAPSAAFAAATARVYGRSPRVVHNGRAAPAPSAAPFTETRDTPVVTAGRLWDEGKAAATLDRAAARMRTPLLAFGPTEGPGGERAAFPHLRLQGFAAPAEVAAALARARVFVSAARYEPFGLAVLEAAQAGCALVLADIATFRELWEDAAVFVAPGDDAGFAAAVEGLLDDAGRCERLARSARRRADRYGLDRFVDATRAVHARTAGAPTLAGTAA